MPDPYTLNYWLCTATLDPELRIKGLENAYTQVITGTVGGAAGVTYATKTATTDCQPNDNVEALRMALDAAGIESRPLWKPMRKQPVYKNAPPMSTAFRNRSLKSASASPLVPG